MTMGPRNIERCMLGRTPLWVVADHSYPMVHFTVSLRQGAVTDGPGCSGTLNAMLEMLLRGTTQRSRRLFHTALETLGSSLEAVVGQEQAFMAGSALARHVHQTVDLLTEAWLSPAFLQEELQHLIEETKQALLSERDDDEALADYFLRQALYGEHPLGRAAEGSMADLCRLSLAQVKAAYARLSADDLIIGVVGDISADLAAALFTPLVTGLPGAALPRVTPVHVPKPDGLHIILVDKPERSQVQLRMARLALDAYHPEVDAFWLGIMAFGGTFTSPLTREIRDERGWSYFAQADFHRRAAFPAPVVLRSAPGMGHAVACLTLQLALYTGLAQGHLAQADISLAREYVLNRYVFEVATAYDIIGPAVALERLNLPATRLWDLPERLEQLDVQHIPEVMARHLQPEPTHCVATLVAPAKILLPKLQRALPAAQISVVDFRQGLGLNIDA